MHPFEYVAAHNIDEAVGLLNEKDVRARSLVGGTDILVQLRGDRREIDRIVDIKPIPEMNELSFNPGGRRSSGCSGFLPACVRAPRNRSLLSSAC